MTNFRNDPSFVVPSIPKSGEGSIIGRIFIWENHDVDRDIDYQWNQVNEMDVDVEYKLHHDFSETPSGVGPADLNDQIREILSDVLPKQFTIRNLISL